jgi:oligopeptide transport system substrate-binding protein
MRNVARISKISRWMLIVSTGVLASFSLGFSPTSWNNPYPAKEEGQNILYSAFSERPKHLDPVQSYSSNEYAFIGQIYEPPLQYHYLKRPYTLIALTATEVPRPHYFDAKGRRLPETAPVSQIAHSTYEIRIQPGIYYQPHPAFARDESNNLRYHKLTKQDLKKIYTLSDFAFTGTRELVAADYVYQIKRLAHPKLHSPIHGLMSDYIIGLNDYAKTLAKAYDEIAKDRDEGVYLNLTLFPLEGVEIVDRYTYRIKIHGKYPQFLYWQAMPFFAPIPPEADKFYSQPGMAEKNLTLDWYPVGTGPFMLTVNNPNRQMVVERNPNFHGEPYPKEGEMEDAALGLLKDAGEPIPFIDKAVYSLEKENIPYWNKFLQGYYDTSGITSDSFDQAVQITGKGEIALTDSMIEKGIRLLTAVRTTTIYMGLNMLDPVVGGYSESTRKLRQALSIAMDYEEYISIFLNGRGIAAQGPLPPGLFGYIAGQEGINPYVYDWINGRPARKPITAAKRLLAEAGYPDGRDAQSGKPLLLHLDITAAGPDDKARLDWIRKQFQKLNIQLVVRNTDYNRFQEKMLTGNAQIFIWGWNADYPDPENFLFLLHGPNSKVEHNGENAANYDNPKFNRLFEKMKNMENSPERLSIIEDMVKIARRDAPWIWGFHPKDFGLYHVWYQNSKPNLMANNTLKYKRIDPQLRTQKRAEWNQPVVWPLVVLAAVMFLGILPAVIAYRRRERLTQR